MHHVDHLPQSSSLSLLSPRALRFATSFARSVLVYVLSFVLAAQPLLAQTAQIQADANASAANRPTVGAAANGVPLVNIATPSAAGLSHNKYQKFNVGTPGAILNNSNANVANSQLGGLVQGNANLRSTGPARVILNEVTGTSRSQLSGTVEVHGSRADVIIANPNGITCNGCGFINTPRVTLSTGTPKIGTDGNLLNLQVNGGDIRIGENGADLGSVSVFDIVSRGISVEGPVKAGNALNLIAGRNSYAYQTGLITPLASDGNEPAIAIDSSLLGGMYAGRIKLVATDKGAGVNMQGQMAANAEAMTLSADGKLTLRKARAKGKITAHSKAGEVVVQDTLFSDDAIEIRGISGVTVNDNAFVGAANNVTVEGGAVTVGTNAVVAAGTDETGNLGTSGTLLITASSLTAGNGELVGAGAVDIRAALIDITRDTDTGASNLRSLGSLTLEADRIEARNGRVVAGDTLSILAANGLTLSEGFYASASALLVDAPAITSSATLRSASTVTLRGTAGDVGNSGVVAGDTGTTVTASGDLTNSGQIQSNAAVTVAAGGTLTNQVGAKITGVTGATVTAAALNNQGQIGADTGALAANVTGNAENTGTLFSGGIAALRLDGGFINSGAIAANGTLIVQGLTASHAGYFDNLAGAEINVGAPSFFVSGFTNSGTINAHSGGIVLDSTGDAINAGTMSAKADIELLLDGTLVNSGSIEAEGTLTFSGRNGGTLDTLTTTAGSLINGTNGLTIRGVTITNAGEVGAANGPLLVELSGSLDNTGLIYSGTSAALRVDGDVANTGADILAEADLTIRGLSDSRAGAILNSSGNIEAIFGTLSITAASLENTRSRFSIGTTTTSSTVTSGATTTTTEVTREVLEDATAPSKLLAGGNIVIDTSGAVTNGYSQIAANGNITINAANVTNMGRDLVETTTVTSVTQHSERYCARRFFGICVNHKTRRWTTTDTSTSSSTYDAVYATIAAGGALIANVIGYVTNDAVREGAGQIGLSSGDRTLDTADASAADDIAGNDLTKLTVAANDLLGRSALFETNLEPDAPFLIETRSQFIDLAKFLGSDYFLDLAGGHNPDLALKRFGDAYAETRLIRDQIFELTGKRLLWGHVDERTQMQRLYDNAFAAQKDLSLAFGIALTPEQQAALTRDIIWLEAQVVAGQRVLVPRVYLSSVSRRNIDLNSARLTANTTDVTAAGVSNSGRIAGWSGVEINTSANFENFGGSLFSDASIAIRAGGTFDNRSGAIDGRTISIAAADIINSTAVTRDTWFNGYSDRAHQRARINATGTLEIDSSGSYEAIGGDAIAGGGLTIRAGDTITIAALGLERLRDDQIDGGYDRESSLAYRTAKVEAGGHVVISGKGDIGLAGASVTAGGNAEITSETGNVTIAGVQDRRSSELKLTIETGGFLGTKTDIERTSASTTTKASTITAAGDVTVTAKARNITVQATDVTSGGETTLSADQGQVALLANIDSDFAQDKKREEDIGWWNSRDQGHAQETVRHVKIDASGGLKIVAGQGVIAEIEATGSLDGAIAQLSQKPGMDWVAGLRERNDVEWRKIAPVLQEWDHKEQGLTEAGAALVALAVTAVSAGTLTQFSAFLAGALPAGIQPATAAALKAGMSSLLSRTSVSMINNGGNISAVLKELGSSSSLKALATAMLSAGLTSGITDAVGLGGTLPASASLTERATFSLQRNLVRATVNAGVSTAVQGGKLDKALLNAMRTAAASTIGEIAANEIGAAYSEAATDGKDIGEYLVHKAAHAGIGCATAAIGNGDCGSGAIGGAAGAAVSEGYQAITQPQLSKELNNLRTKLADQNLSNAEIDARLNAQFQDWRNRGVDLSKLSAGLLAAASGADVDEAATTAGNAAEHNVLPAIIIVAKIGIAAYTAYELYETAKQAVALADQLARGEPLTEAQLRNAALQLGIDVALGVTVSKLKILEASYDLAIKAGDKIGATKLAKYISDFEVRSEGVGSFPGNVRVGRKTPSAGPKLTIRDQYAHHKAMTDDLKAQLEDQGYRVSDKEVSFGSACGTGRCRPDIVYETPDGKVRIIEVKTGNADLSIRQSKIFPQINSGASVPRGDVARKFGLRPNISLREQGYPNGIPIEVRIFPGAN